MKILKNIIVRLSSPVDKENGSATIVALLVLVLLTVFGMTALTTTDSELKVVGGERVYLQDFFAADSGWRIAARMINLDPLPLRMIDPEEGTVKTLDTNEEEDGNVGSIPYWYGAGAKTRSVKTPGNTMGFLKYQYELESNGDESQIILVGLSKMYKTLVNYGQ